jgi:lipopolysaccharide export LptBFGC system permease protein LptF
MGDSEAFHPVVLAWLPTILFLLAALVLLDRVKS